MVIFARECVKIVNYSNKVKYAMSHADVTHEDNGNYTCEVRAPEAIVLGYVTHHVFVRGDFVF